MSPGSATALQYRTQRKKLQQNAEVFSFGNKYLISIHISLSANEHLYYTASGVILSTVFSGISNKKGFG